MPSLVKPKCHPRKRFGTRESAQSAGVRIANTLKQYRLPEPCQHCNGWHLSQEIKTK